MSLDTVDVVHEMEEALGSIAHECRDLLSRIEPGPRALAKAVIVSRLLGLAVRAEGAIDEDSALGEWRARSWVKSLEEQFWARVDQRGPDECWPWSGPLMPPPTLYMILHRDDEGDTGVVFATEDEGARDRTRILLEEGDGSPFTAYFDDEIQLEALDVVEHLLASNEDEDT